MKMITASQARGYAKSVEAERLKEQEANKQRRTERFVILSHKVNSVITGIAGKGLYEVILDDQPLIKSLKFEICEFYADLKRDLEPLGYKVSMVTGIDETDRCSTFKLKVDWNVK